MKTKNIYDYVSFGQVITYLRFIRIDFPYYKEAYVKDNLERLIKNIGELNLKVTSKVIWLRELIEYKKSLDKKSSDYTLNKEDVNKITELMHKIQNVITAELQGRIVFVITEHRLKVDKLLDEMKDLFAQDVFNTLPDLSRFDFNESGKCIAFERATAGAFHVLRGMEGILRWFFDRLTGSSGCKDNWGNMIVNSKKISTPPPSEILDQLDAIRLNYRNPTAHPELIYTIDEGQDLLSECIAVVNRIVHHLKENNLLQVF